MKKVLRNQKGFTLVEIIAVLILLGILAAVAVPKFIDLTDVAADEEQGLSPEDSAYLSSLTKMQTKGPA